MGGTEKKYCDDDDYGDTMIDKRTGEALERQILADFIVTIKSHAVWWREFIF